MQRRWWLPLALLTACPADPLDETPTDSADGGQVVPDEPSPLLDVEETESWTLPGLKAEAHVVYTAMGVPHVYAADRADLGRVVGFTLARDRFFYMDLASRLSLGTTAELLGDAALETDAEQRQFGATFIADRVLGLLDADPDMAAYFDGVAAGVNAYIEAVRAGTLPPPSEYDLAAALLGKSEPVDLMVAWDRRRVAGGLVTVLYESGFETKDVGRARDAQRLGTVFDGAPLEQLREDALLESWGRVEPPKAVAQAPDWTPSASAAPARRATSVPVHGPVLDRLHEATQRMEKRLGHDWEHGFGSNAWAVSASKSADGRALVATDGHLPLSIPPLFYQIGIDTKHLGGGSVQQVGMMTPAMPLISTGTNGDVAFGQTQLIGDITDWYAERLILDGAGRPVASAFQGGTQPLTAVTETIQIAGVSPALGSPTPSTFTFERFTTFDGRWITQIEGDEVDDPAGTPAVYLGNRWIVPRDVDGDGHVTAVSFDYAGLDLSNMARTIDQYASATDLDAFREATKNLVAYSLNLVAADSSGSIFYTGFQAVPCRRYLARNPDGTWKEGADPNLLLHGWEYGGFTIPIADDGTVDFSQGADAYRCVVPYDSYPQSRDPAQGFLVSANNDPGGLTFDGSITNDPYYIGGPWMEGYRADEITRELTARSADGGVTIDDMKAIQANHTSVLGRDYTPELLGALDAADAIAAGPTPAADSAEERILALRADNLARFAEARSRLEAWGTRGYQAESGVDTFYEQPTAEEKDDAVATMIFNAWIGRWTDLTVDDEGLPGLGFPTGDTGRFRMIEWMLASRGSGNPAQIAGWNPATQEHVYFDVKSTDPVETSTEVALIALEGALDFLEGPPKGPGEGGFGTTDMSQWLWGLRHTVRMTSLLGDFFGIDDPLFANIIDPFNITPKVFPVAEGLASGDPRANLPGFPRHADNLCVDAANSGTNGTTFDNAYGSVWRLVVALGPDGFEAYNIIPGGQSGLNDSEHFADQAKLWLANETLPVQISPAEVAAAGEWRAAFRPE